MACSFLASSYSEFSEMSPNSRASLMRSATSRRRVVCRSFSSSLSFSRPSGVRITSRAMALLSGPRGQKTPLIGGDFTPLDQVRAGQYSARLGGPGQRVRTAQDRSRVGHRGGPLEGLLEGLAAAEALDVPRIELAQI